MKPNSQTLEGRIRLMIIFFMVMLVISGITASPVESELAWILAHPGLTPDFMEQFLRHCYEAIRETNAKYPQVAYGFDWLAFAHVMIAVAFVGPLRDPVKNIWVIEWAMWCCVAVIPLALIAGPVREIPFFWTLIDCSFGLVGIIPLYFCRKWTLELVSPKV